MAVYSNKDKINFMTDTAKPSWSQRLFRGAAKKHPTLTPWERKAIAENHDRYLHAPLTEALSYKPFHLQVVTNTSCMASCTMCYGHSPALEKNFYTKNQPKDMDLPTFQLVLKQLPTIQTIEFSGWGEPLMNGQIFEMVDFAEAYNGAVSTIVTNGMLLENRLDALMASSLHQLTVSINGHTADSYVRMTGMPAENFELVRRNVVKTLQERLRRRLSHPKVMLSFILDRDNYAAMNEMIQFAQELHVEGVVFHNYQSPDPSVKSERSLYSDDVAVQELFQTIRANFYQLEVQLPNLLDRKMDNHRYCSDAFTTVSVDGDCNVSACSKQLLYNGKMGKVWESDFWNNDLFQWLRGVHGAGQHDVPRPCQACDHNCALTKSKKPSSIFTDLQP